MAVGRSILLTRDGEGRAHAFLNYCRHRGAEPARGCGNARAFLCPYHGWSYDMKGRLLGMPLRDRFKDLDFDRMGLVELPCEERHGFVWVVLRPGHPIDVAKHLGDLDAEIASIGAERMTYFNALPEEPLATNWKSVTEGLLEGLHVPFVHAGTFATNPQALDLDLGYFDAVGPHVRWVLPIFTKADVARIRATPEAEWKPNELVACVWWISPGLLLAHEYYGLIYADLSPGEKPSESVFRYGWISPILEAPEGLAFTAGDGGARGGRGPAGQAGLGGMRARTAARGAWERGDRAERAGSPVHARERGEADGVWGADGRAGVTAALSSSRPARAATGSLPPHASPAASAARPRSRRTDTARRRAPPSTPPRPARAPDPPCSR